MLLDQIILDESVLDEMLLSPCVITNSPQSSATGLLMPDQRHFHSLKLILKYRVTHKVCDYYDDLKLLEPDDLKLGLGFLPLL